MTTRVPSICIMQLPEKLNPYENLDPADNPADVCNALCFPAPVPRDL